MDFNSVNEKNIYTDLLREFQKNVLAKSIYAIIEGQKNMIRQLDEFLVKKEQMITT